VPEGVAIIAMGNRDTDKGITFKMATPISNRFVHIEMRSDFDDWQRWALGAFLNADVVGYLTAFQHHLFDFEPGSAARGFATPRSWHALSDILNANDDLPDMIAMGLICGSIGDGIGVHPVNQHSDALLGIFDAIAPLASRALGQLSQGHVKDFHATLLPTIALSRHIFQAPTRFYKTGVVFMAWLNGHQSHFSMVGGQQGARSVPHLCQLFQLADQAHLFHHPEQSMLRMKQFLAVHGVD
jgi:hypothetical protein